MKHSELKLNDLMQAFVFTRTLPYEIGKSQVDNQSEFFTLLQ
jgi:hypothetical protein